MGTVAICANLFTDRAVRIATTPTACGQWAIVDRLYFNRALTVGIFGAGIYAGKYFVSLVYAIAVRGLTIRIARIGRSQTVRVFITGGKFGNTDRASCGTFGGGRAVLGLCPVTPFLLAVTSATGPATILVKKFGVDRGFTVGAAEFSVNVGLADGGAGFELFGGDITTYTASTLYRFDALVVDTGVASAAGWVIILAPRHRLAAGVASDTFFGRAAVCLLYQTTPGICPTASSTAAATILNFIFGVNVTSCTGPIRTFIDCLHIGVAHDCRRFVGLPGRVTAGTRGALVAIDIKVCFRTSRRVTNADLQLMDTHRQGAGIPCVHGIRFGCL